MPTRLLVDECVPRRVARALADLGGQTVQQAGWSGVKNGKLLALAAGQFDVIFTVDRDFANLTDSVPVALDVVILEVGTTDADLLFPHVGRVRSAIAAVAPGQVVRLTL